MIFPRLARVSLLIFVTVFLAPMSRAAAARSSPTRPTQPSGTYKGAVVIDAATGNVLFEDNADIISPPASMTKLMTFAVLHDKLSDHSLSLQTPVTVTAADSKMGGTQVFLKEKEVFSVEELLYAMMIQSANDAAHALARTAGGSVEAFVALMNAKAQALGMTHTTFRSPHGLPPASRRIADGDLTSPRDFALLSQHLLVHTDVLTYASVRQRDFGPNRPGGPQHMENHNKLLGKVVGVDGLKTGYTVGAGYCLSATAQRNGRRIISVVMGAFGPKGSIDKGQYRDLKTLELIEKGFAALPASSAPFAGSAVSQNTTASPITAAPLSPAEKKDDNAPPSINFSLPPKKK